MFQRLFEQLKVYLVELDKNGIDGRLIYDIEDNEYYDQPVFNFEGTLAGDFDDDDYDSYSQIDIDEAPTTFLDQMNQNLKKNNAKASPFWQTFSGNNVSKILEKLGQLFIGLDKSERCGCSGMSSKH
uniref:HUN domain-containing protein n=1 Tax=Rhabditophanes sp. KR3021 TaxID=114890 RepID=A0AC35U1N6_9BILA